MIHPSSNRTATKNNRKTQPWPGQGKTQPDTRHTPTSLHSYLNFSSLALFFSSSVGTHSPPGSIVKAIPIRPGKGEGAGLSTTSSSLDAARALRSSASFAGDGVATPRDPGIAGDTAAAAPPVSSPGIESDMDGRAQGLPVPRCSWVAVLTGLSPTPPAEGNTSTKSSSIGNTSAAVWSSGSRADRDDPTQAQAPMVKNYYCCEGRWYKIQRPAQPTLVPWLLQSEFCAVFTFFSFFFA